MSAAPFTYRRPLHLLPLPYTQLRRVVRPPLADAALIYHYISILRPPLLFGLTLLLFNTAPVRPTSCLIKASLRCAPPVYTPLDSPGGCGAAGPCLDSVQ